MFSLIGFFVGICAPVLRVGMTEKGIDALRDATLPEAMQEVAHDHG